MRVQGHTAATGSLSSRVGQQCHQLMTLPLPMGLCHTCGIRHSLAMAGSFVWANECSYYIERDGWGLGPSPNS